LTTCPVVFQRSPGRWRCLLLVFTLLPAGAFADEATVAVAANFLPVLRTLARDFQQTSDHRLRISAGSTGKLYAQIRHGAPFDVFLAAVDVFLAADAARPGRLEREGHGVPGSRFTYAIGRLVLWSPRPGLFDDGLGWLQQGRFTRLALANPKTAQVRARAYAGGSLWPVPDTDHDPLEQQAILLKRGQKKPAARAFHAWLRSEPARERIRAAGYALPGAE